MTDPEPRIMHSIAEAYRRLAEGAVAQNGKRPGGDLCANSTFTWQGSLRCGEASGVRQVGRESSRALASLATFRLSLSPAATARGARGEGKVASDLRPHAQGGGWCWPSLVLLRSIPLLGDPI